MAVSSNLVPKKSKAGTPVSFKHGCVPTLPLHLPRWSLSEKKQRSAHNNMSHKQKNWPQQHVESSNKQSDQIRSDQTSELYFQFQFQFQLLAGMRFWTILLDFIYVCIEYTEACEHRCVTNHPMSCGTQVHRVKLACTKTAPDTLFCVGHECSDTMLPESSGLSESYVHRVGLFWLHLVKLTWIKTAPNTHVIVWICVWKSLCQTWMFGHDVTRVIRFEWILRASCGTRAYQNSFGHNSVWVCVSHLGE